MSSSAHTGEANAPRREASRDSIPKSYHVVRALLAIAFLYRSLEGVVGDRYPSPLHDLFLQIYWTSTLPNVENLLYPMLLFSLLFLGCLGIFHSVWVRRSVIVVTLFAPSLLAGFVTLSTDHIANNLRLNRYADQLHSYALPEGTEVVHKARHVGILGGNGNHCDFHAKLYLDASSYGSSRDGLTALKKHYEKIAFSPVKGKLFKDSVDTARVVDSTDFLGSTHLVELFSGGYRPGWDFRCH